MIFILSACGKQRKSEKKVPCAARGGGVLSHRPASSPRRRSGVPSFLRIDFRSAPRIGKARAMVLVMRVDWCV
jgi:hypothetical protein